MDFSLFYFASDAGGGRDQYRLLIEGAKFADEHGLSAVWTPERHFHQFGGLFPNASVTSAALAMVTNKVQLRAGSVVLPLHHPVRVAEEWSSSTIYPMAVRPFRLHRAGIQTTSSLRQEIMWRDGS